MSFEGQIGTASIAGPGEARYPGPGFSVLGDLANHTPKERVVRDIGRVVIAMASPTD